MFPTGGNGHAFISKSPETGGVGEAVSHGTFGAELKRAGYDAVILTGKAEKPVYLWIDDDHSPIDASQLGKSPKPGIKTKWVLHPRRIHRFSRRKTLKIATNKRKRAAGRTGRAVMGSKTLKPYCQGTRYSCSES
jgi:aldehyde:ferredoxin oxidoreductase